MVCRNAVHGAGFPQRRVGRRVHPANPPPCDNSDNRNEANSPTMTATAPLPPLQRKQSTTRPLTVAQIANKLNAAILEHRLPPGTKLAEERLSDIFAVSRARIREVLTKLANQHVVEIVPHRGAHVAKPSVEEAKDIFEARRLIEPFSIRKIVTDLDAEATVRLRAHATAELRARECNDEPAIVRLSGEFHILLAELADNAPLLRTTRELATQTCLIISLYSPSTVSSCRADEHSEIIQAIVARNADRATQLLLEHLDHIRNSLDLDRVDAEINLEEVFA